MKTKKSEVVARPSGVKHAFVPRADSKLCHVCWMPKEHFDHDVQPIGMHHIFNLQKTRSKENSGMNTRPRTPDQRLRAFQTRLRSMGFKCTANDRGSRKDWCQIYERLDGEVKVEVQLWCDGSHRVSHFHQHNDPEVRAKVPGPGQMDSSPSGFKTVEGMCSAIEFERTRYRRGVPKDEQRNFE